MAVLELTSSDMKSTIASGVTLVKFGAPWCGPCRQIAPIIEQLATDYAGKAKVGDVNIDNSQDLAQEFGIRSVPTTMIFKDGEMVDTIMGMQSAAVLTEKLDSFL